MCLVQLSTRQRIFRDQKGSDALQSLPNGFPSSYVHLRFVPGRSKLSEAFLFRWSGLPKEDLKRCFFISNLTENGEALIFQGSVCPLFNDMANESAVFISILFRKLPSLSQQEGSSIEQTGQPSSRNCADSAESCSISSRKAGSLTGTEHKMRPGLQTFLHVCLDLYPV